jgi:hypothetical protein
MTPEHDLIAVGKTAATALAHAIHSLPSFVGPDGGTYSLAIVSEPEISGSNWMLIVDVGLPDGNKRIEFSIVQTGWGGFVPGESRDA